MKKIQCLAMILILLFSLLISPNILAEENQFNIPVSPDQYGQGFRYNVQGWIYLHIQGDPYERGYQHGYLLSAEIVDMLDRWGNIIHNYPVMKLISKRLSDSRYEKVANMWWNFCTKNCYRMYWNKFPEEYQSEIKGIADGVTVRGGKIHGRDVTYKDILAMNEMYEFMSKLTRIPKGIHPLRTFFHQLEKVVPETSYIGATSFIESFLNQEPAHHCNGFIATGNATTNGQLVVTHSTICGGGMWWWTYYISLRWNVMLDLQPTDGNRIMMPTSPGFIWSDEDYYQNDAGIVLLETTVPQGLFDNKGLPLSVRVRNAMQYGTSIDDVIYHLRYKNDGSMNAVWLIGDTKTGEISRFELGYKAYAVHRKFDGFYWSANNPYDIKVRMEKFNLKKYFEKILYSVLKIPGFGYYSIIYRPEGRDLKYEELGKKYYGQIDIDIVKEIASTSPISDWITDSKITDSKLLEQNGVWAFFGNPWEILNISNIDVNVEKIRQVYPCGWVRLFGVPSKEDFNVKRQDKDYGEKAKILWEFDTENNVNNFYSSGSIHEDILYVTTSEGMIYSINAKSGQLKWGKYVGEKPTTPVVNDYLLFVGHSEGLSVLDLNGNVKWEVPTADVVSNPVIVDENVIYGDNIGNVYASSVSDKKKQWQLNFSDEAYISSTFNDHIYVTSGNSCYAVGINDHKVLWKFGSDGMITSAPVLVDNTVYFTSWDNFVYALSASTGNLKWKYETGWGFDTSPAVYKGLVFAGSADNNLYALHVNTGSLEWVFSSKAAIHSAPVAYGEYVFFGSDDGRFYALNISTGEPAWSFAPGLTIDDDVYNFITTPIVSDSVANDGMIYIGSNGTIYALNAQTFESSRDDEHGNDEHGNQQEDTADESSFLPIIIMIVVIIIIFLLFWIRKRN